MKKFLLLTLCTAIMGACIDDEYDLGKNIDTDNVGIGDPDSEFVMPLANIHVGSDELLAGKGDITALFSDVEFWIPISYEYIDVQRLGDSRYIDQWAGDLCKGMDNDAEFTRVVEHIHETRMEDFSQWVDPNTDLGTYKATFKALWSDTRTRSEIENKIGEIIASETATLDTEVVYNCPIQNDGLDEGVIDMLIDGQNDDALALFGTIQNRMEPIECTLKAEFVDTSVKIENVSLPAASRADIPYVNIPAEDVYTIVQNGVLQVTLTPVKFYPRTAYPRDELMSVQLKLRKRGGLKVN